MPVSVEERPQSEQEIEKAKQKMYAIMIEEIEFLHEEQASMSRSNVHFTGDKIAIAQTIFKLCKMLGY